MSKYLGWKSFEREITTDLKKNGHNAKRNWSNQFSKTDPIDVFSPPFGIQCKYGARPNMVEAYEQAKKNKGIIPVGVARWKGEQKTLVCIDWKTFLQLIG